MAQGNGMSIDGMAVPPSETASFVVGGATLQVPALTLWDLELSRTEMQALTPDLVWSTYAATVVKIIARKLRPEHADEFAEALLRKCSVREAQNLAVAFNTLLAVSGFEMGEAEAVAESSGTGTSIESPQNSPSPSEFPTST